jgi:uncharacterized membrane protein YbhN (UPF0104 family)
VKHWLFAAISFAAVIGVSAYAVRNSAPDGVHLAIPPLAHALALIAFAVDIGCRSLKFTFTARAVGERLPFFTAMRAGLGGDFAGAITPSRAGSEPARYLILAESGMKGPVLIVLLYAELFFEMISLVVIAMTMRLLFNEPRAAILAMTGVLVAYSSAILGIGLAGVLLSRRPLGDEPPPWAARLRITGTRWALLRRTVERVRITVDAFKTMHRGWGAASLAASIVHVAARFSTLPILVLVILDARVPLGPLVVWPFSLFYGGNMVPAPGGGGAVELAFAAALGPAIPAAAFAAAMVWWRFYSVYLFAILGGVVAGGIALRALQKRTEWNRL